MPSTLTIVRQRRRRRNLTRRSAEGHTGRTLFGFGFAVSAVVVVALLAAALAYADLTRSLPPVEELPILLNPQDGLLLQPTRLYDRTGQHLLAALAPAPGMRGYIPYDQIPKTLVDATLVLADAGFWRHPGYILQGWQDPGTHPTLAQKLASDLLLWDEAPSPRRAIRERFLAAQMTARYGREKVLEWYLNSADYGQTAFGVEAAAQLYFGKPATQLDLGESALLAAVSQAPALNPIDAPQAAELLRLETLRIMQTRGLVTADQVAQATATSPVLLPRPAQADLAPSFVNLAMDQLGRRFDRARLERGGLEIITTLDYDLQLQTACTVQTQLARLSGDTAEVLAADGSPCQTARLLPTLAPGVSLPGASASALILDPRNGQILAAVGDVSAGQESLHLASHPAGTIITPFIYLTGFTRGLNPASLGWDIPGDVPDLGAVYHGPVRLRIALANDYLPPAERVLRQMGAESVRGIAESFGLAIPPGARLLQEDFDVSLLELAGAYGIFADQGTQAGQAVAGVAIRPAAVLKVLGADHSVWLDWTVAQTRSVVSPQLAYLMNHVLSDETARWPSLGHPNPLEIGRPAGAKTGRTLRSAQGDALNPPAAWIAGYIPQRVVVVWMGSAGSGSASPASAGGETNPGEASGVVPPRLAAGLWHGLMQSAVSDLPPVGWEMPSGIVTVEVCDPSGLLPTAACPNVVSEVFLSDRQPVQSDNLYQTFQVNRETGLLATVFTPPELVEARVYMVVPPEARQWAKTEGIPAPPSAYDTLQMPPYSPEVHITSPSMFADAHGVVEIRGSAGGADFAYYRLEFEQGLYPQTWVQVGKDSTSPVSEGLLASWDTQGLNGLYALRLMVVHGDQQVRQAVVQVTVDNTPPQVAVIYPLEGQMLSRGQEPQVALQAQVNEAYLAKVDFYMDGTQLGEFSAAPFGLVWPATIGGHTFRIVATDRAGNQAEAKVRFTVNK